MVVPHPFMQYTPHSSLPFASAVLPELHCENNPWLSRILQATSPYYIRHSIILLIVER
jgi:hypothetical protein